MTSRSLRASGSSPLARGLRKVASQLPVRQGIIPARAGFTDNPSGANKSETDHPRSRGVYDVENMRGAILAGSSPLARGLRDREAVEFADVGIIPARAGFTPRRVLPRRLCTDHPRSRGVYTDNAAITPCISGSSPLARGLPVPASIRLQVPGIIPARAGFTNRFHVKHSSKKDHPRSRGVYATNIRT